jgi:hypothetical protein
MDDFSVHGMCFESCLKNLEKVLERCGEIDPVLNCEKCHFMVKQGIVLGHVISERGVEVDKAKIETVEKLPPPTNIKSLRSFLGHARFYRRFINVRHGYPWVPTDQGPRGPCQVDPTCQKPCRLVSGPRDLILNLGDLGRPWTTLSRLQKTCRACEASFSLDHGGGAASRSKDRGILSVIMEGDLPKSITDPDEGPPTSSANPSPPTI